MKNRGPLFRLHKLHACLEQDKYALHPHFWEGLRELSVDLNDVLHVLRHGRTENALDFDPSLQQWRFKTQGLTVEGKQLTIVFAFAGVEELQLLSISTPRA
jgi:hypothetical protein